MAVHVGEMIAAVYYCQKLRLNNKVTVAWTVQTLLFGIFSLWYLIWPQRELKPETVTKSD